MKFLARICTNERRFQADTQTKKEKKKKHEKSFAFPLDKRTNVLYNDMRDFVALCGKATKTE